MYGTLLLCFKYNRCDSRLVVTFVTRRTEVKFSRKLSVYTSLL